MLTFNSQLDGEGSFNARFFRDVTLRSTITAMISSLRLSFWAEVRPQQGAGPGMVYACATKSCVVMALA